MKTYWDDYIEKLGIKIVHMSIATILEGFFNYLMNQGKIK